MKYSDLPSNWSSTLESLELHSGQAQPPTGLHSPWYAPIMRFGKRGFFMAFLNKEDSKPVQLRLEFVPPTSAPDKFVHELQSRLETLGLTIDSVTPTASGQPVLLHTSVSEHLERTPDDIQALLLLLMKLGDYTIALDTDPNTPSPLEHNTQTIQTPLTTETPAGFEVIGDHAPKKEEPAPQSSGSPFENIGASTPQSSSSSTGTGVSSFKLSKHAHHLELELSLGKDTPQELLHSLEKNMSVRFDAEVRINYRTPNPVMELSPALTTATRDDLEALYRDTHRYMDRMVDMSSSGISLDNIADKTSTSRASMLRTTRRDIPSTLVSKFRDKITNPTESSSQETTGFVLPIEPSHQEQDESPATTFTTQAHTLKAGDFTDERLRREDSTGALVDVVLRHPGYSDRNMAKVLTLLLSIEYSQALVLIESSPCVLAWGTGNERAQTMKNVIEGAGGKVVLVEPDTFAPN